MLLNKHIVNRAFQLRLTTLSPVAINSGNELSPLADYFVLNGNVRYVDSDKFQVLLFDNPELLERYEAAVMKTNIEGADNFLNRLIESSDQLKNISYSDSLPYKGKKTLLLKEIIKSRKLPYIPGSSVKGAIKNALLYYWLTKESTNTIEQFILENEGNFKIYLDLMPAYSKLKKLKSKTKWETEEFRRIGRLEKDILNNINTFINTIEDKAFGIARNIMKQPASNLKISDSTTISLTENVEIAALQRRSLYKGLDWELHTQEYIKPGAELGISLQISDVNQDWKSFSEKSLFKKVLQDSDGNLKPLFKVLNHFANAVQEVQDIFKLETSVKNYKADVNEAILFLGNGKGIYKNTVLLAVRNYYELSGKEFITEFAPLIWKIKSEFDDFPNSVAHIHNQALGWVKITDLNRLPYIERSEKSYTLEALHSGQPIEAIFKQRGKPLSVVIVNLDGTLIEMNVQGAKYFLQMGNQLANDAKCIVYWRNNHLNFNEK